MSTTFLPLRLQMQQFNSKIIFAHMCCERKRKRREEEEDKISNPGMHFFLSHCSTVLVAWLISAHGRRSFFINCQSFSFFFSFFVKKAAFDIICFWAPSAGGLGLPAGSSPSRIGIFFLLNYHCRFQSKPNLWVKHL